MFMPILCIAVHLLRVFQLHRRSLCPFFVGVLILIILMFLFQFGIGWDLKWKIVIIVRTYGSQCQWLEWVIQNGCESLSPLPPLVCRYTDFPVITFQPMIFRPDISTQWNVRPGFTTITRTTDDSDTMDQDDDRISASINHEIS
jgi:hypothetical protein